MGILKSEDLPAFPNQPLAYAQTGRPSSNVSLTNSSTSEFPEPPEEELELPPRMKQMVDIVKQMKPDLLQNRYSEFVGLEEKIAKAPVEEAYQIKLYKISCLS